MMRFASQPILSVSSESNPAELSEPIINSFSKNSSLASPVKKACEARRGEIYSFAGGSNLGHCSHIERATHAF